MPTVGWVELSSIDSPDWQDQLPLGGRDLLNQSFPNVPNNGSAQSGWVAIGGAESLVVETSQPSPGALAWVFNYAQSAGGGNPVGQPMIWKTTFAAIAKFMVLPVSGPYLRVTVNNTSGGLISPSVDVRAMATMADPVNLLGAQVVVDQQTVNINAGATLTVNPTNTYGAPFQAWYNLSQNGLVKLLRFNGTAFETFRLLNISAGINLTDSGTMPMDDWQLQVTNTGGVAANLVATIICPAWI